MGLSVHTRAWRAGIVACSLAWFGPVGAVRAETGASSPPAVEAQPSVEPFGLSASELSGGGLYEKWRSVQNRLDDERVQIALCDGDRDNCVSAAALKFLGIVDAARLRDGRARLGEINRAINLAIRPLSEYGDLDVWMPPLETFSRGGGDCEDYAIAKFVALQLAGVAADDIRIVVLRNTIRGEDHAVAAARLDGHWLMLDNRRMAMVADADVRNLRPTFVIGPQGVMRYSDDRIVADASDENATTTLIMRSAAASIDQALNRIH